MSPAKKKQDPTVLSEILTAENGSIGVITLNSEKTLNSLTLEMVRLITEQLKTWAKDNAISVIVLRGAGEKAFCAGGDVQQLYQSAISQPGGPCEYGETFFCEEYQLNHMIHSYEKPILCLGHGIVMGGGLGLMAGASHRVATEKTRIAMPEITIGLFPDVGGTWFLNRMPMGLGIFYALTGAPINAPDALITKLADYVIPSRELDSCLSVLSKVSWSDDVEANHQLLGEQLSAMSYKAKSLSNIVESELQAHIDFLESACQESSLGEIVRRLGACDTDSRWYQKALKAMEHGSALSSLLIYEQLKRYRYASLEQIFERELILATNIIRYPEFAEGVRALLIDKDNEPKWQFPHFSAVPASVLESFFVAPWQDSPLLLAA